VPAVHELNPIVQEAQQQGKEKVMKAFAQSILFTGALVMGASGLMAVRADKTNMSLKQLVKQTEDA
jgi:hypothetical protein